MTLIMPRFSSKNGLVKSVIFDEWECQTEPFFRSPFVTVRNKQPSFAQPKKVFFKCKICSLMHNQQRLMHDCHVQQSSREELES